MYISHCYSQYALRLLKLIADILGHEECNLCVSVHALCHSVAATSGILSQTCAQNNVQVKPELLPRVEALVYQTSRNVI